MNKLRLHLEKKLREAISTFNEDEIYAISFFVYSNESYEYREFSNVTTFAVSYNTERDCGYAEELSERRWNYAYWRQNEIPIIDYYEDTEGAEILFDWYFENGINNIGYEESAFSCNVSEDRGPVGYYELLEEVTAVAKKLQDEEFIKSKFGKAIPIIIHELEYPWYTIEATKKANAKGEANVFLAALEAGGVIPPYLLEK